MHWRADLSTPSLSGSRPRLTLDAVEAVREHGATVVGIFTVVDRSEGSAGALYAEIGLPLLSVYEGLELLEAARGDAES